MSERNHGQIGYPIRDPNKPPSPPNYERTLAALSNSDLLDEVYLGRGLPEYQAALRAEAERRGLGFLAEPSDAS